MVLFYLFITILYTILIVSFVYGFDKIKSFNPQDLAAKTKFSIIIPFRNESDNLPELLASIIELNYPKNLFEILLVNDGSSDNSLEYIVQFINTNTSSNIQIIQNIRTTNSPKKDAITLAIKQSKYDWIITTDADCKVPKYWLDSFDYFIQSNDTSFIAGPVVFANPNSFLERFQTIDFLSLIGSTIGGFGIGKPFLCNGANLAYKKSLFYTLNGFEGNTNISSGDDIFMLDKAMKESPNHIHFLKTKCAIVSTKPQENYKALLSQRIRWASKTKHYSNEFAKGISILVLMMNAGIISGLLFAAIGLINMKTFFFVFLIKFCVDFLIIFKTARFFNQERYLKSYIISSLIYPFFLVYVAIVSMFSSYKWKGTHFYK